MKIVDAEPIIEELYKISDEKDELGEHEFALGIDTVIYLLEQAKEVDAEPVRHGKWEHYPDCGVTRCSECDWSIEECWYSDFCPNCGSFNGGSNETLHN